MKHAWLLMVVLAAGALTLGAGCDGEYQGKDAGEKAIVAFCKRESADGKITDIEKVDEMEFRPDAKLIKYRVSFTSVDNPNRKATVFMYYDPNSGEVMAE